MKAHELLNSPGRWGEESSAEAGPVGSAGRRLPQDIVVSVLDSASILLLPTCHDAV